MLVNRAYAISPRNKPSVHQARSVKLVAHRGAFDHQKGILENTLQAIERARSLGAEGVEFDVYFTRDRIPVVHHDPNLWRLFRQRDRIEDLYLVELQQKTPHVPTLEEVVHCCGGALRLFIELKTPVPRVSPFSDILAQLAPGEDYYLISLGDHILSPLNDFPEHSKILVATPSTTKRFCQLGAGEGYGGVLGHYLFLTQKRIQALKEQQKMVGVGFIESENSLYREIHRGVEWVFTNDAEHVRGLLDALQTDASE